MSRAKSMIALSRSTPREPGIQSARSSFGVPQSGGRTVIHVDFGRGRNRGPRLPAEHIAFILGGAGILVTLLATLLFIAFVTSASTRQQDANAAPHTTIAAFDPGISIADHF